MKFTIFRRIIMVPGILLISIVLMGLYAVTYLDRITELNTQILGIDIQCIHEEKRLIKTFLAEVRNAEKYLVLQDPDFYAGAQQSQRDVLEALNRIARLADTPDETELVEQIRSLHGRYGEEVESGGLDSGIRKQVRSEISDGFIEKTNELIRIREQIVQNKTATARDEALNASRMIAWFAIGGTVLAFLLAYTQARSISRPLDRLAREMRRLGKGEHVRQKTFKAPPEVHELASTFYSMAEELAVLDAMKSDFTAHVSHELRTPLTAIREGTALMLERIPGPLTSEQAEILEVVKEHSDKLYSAISSILDLNKMEVEMMEYEIAPCDLSAVIEKSVVHIKLIAEKRRVVVDTSCSNGIPLVYADERRMQQVLDNLLSNALKFTPEGGKVSVTAKPLPSNPENATSVEVRVSDNGAGIPESDLEKVFTKFFQSHQDRTQKYRGTGLGLAIAHHIVQAHKGKIWVESAVGKGSTFIFTVPAAIGNAATLERITQ